MPLITQHYIVPIPSSCTYSNTNNDLGVYSMWEHFLDYLKSDYLTVVTTPRSVPLLNPYGTVNYHTGGKRLLVFQCLSQEKSVGV
jgi:hypothetical protein